MKSVSVALLVAAGCASGGSNNPIDSNVDVAVSVDAKVTDSAPQVDTPPPIDAPTMIDAPVMIDAALDAFVMIDAPIDAPCVPVTTQLLNNPAFDLSPMGTMWNQQVIDPMYPLITDQAGFAPHSTPYRAWLGGIEATTGNVTDILWQDVIVPANTTSLVLTGFYDVASGEDPGDLNVYDVASIGFTQTNGTPIATANSFSNVTTTTVWTPINFTLPGNLSGQEIRLRMTSSNDFLNATSFYFDTLELKATHCP